MPLHSPAAVALGQFAQAADSDPPAPFHSASTLQALPSGAEVLIVITTPYWFGVETHDGQHGWVQRDELEMLP